MLRPWKKEDLSDFYEYASHPEVGPNAGWKPHESMEESASILESWLKEEKDTIFALQYKESGRVIGSLGIHSDPHRPDVPDCKMLGYVLAFPYWGKGLMTEAVKAAKEFIFEKMQVQLLTVYHYSFNQRSKRVIEKAEFQFEGILRNGSVLFDQTVVDNCCYSMKSWEYFLHKAKAQGFSLVLPEQISQSAIEDFQKEWKEEKMVPAAADRGEKGFSAWLQRSIQFREETPEGLVNSTLFFLVDKDGVPQGALDLRHVLNDGLRRCGGHIGYGIRPSARGNGLGTLQLALGLEQARKMGILKVLVTCDEWNEKSASVIKRCGGLFENQVMEPHGSVRRYWISLS